MPEVFIFMLTIIFSQTFEQTVYKLIRLFLRSSLIKVCTVCQLVKVRGYLTIFLHYFYKCHDVSFSAISSQKIVKSLRNRSKHSGQT